ncbi:MAG: haloalkane dehalogenase [Microscillaceae bacterium]
MDFLRTPEERFAHLPDYPFAPHYLELEGGLRMHYVAEGPKEASETLLLLHGEPTWSYLYRKMIPILAQAGHRVIAPDLIGFGKSDKLRSREDYSYQSHVDWLAAFITQLDLQNLTLVCQDWGGLIGLRLAAEHEARFKRITASNTFLPTGQGSPSEAFMKWREFSQTVPEMPIGKIVSGGCVNKLSPEIMAAYDAPFPDETYKEAARIFPALVPISEEDPAVPANLRAWEILKGWQKPFLTAFSDSDPITRGGDAYFQKVVPGTKGQAHTTIAGAGHFVQEDKGEAWAELILDFLQVS